MEQRRDTCNMVCFGQRWKCNNEHHFSEMAKAKQFPAYPEYAFLSLREPLRNLVATEQGYAHLCPFRRRAYHSSNGRACQRQSVHTITQLHFKCFTSLSMRYSSSSSSTDGTWSWGTCRTWSRNSSGCWGKAPLIVSYLAVCCVYYDRDLLERRKEERLPR